MIEVPAYATSNNNNLTGEILLSKWNLENNLRKRQQMKQFLHRYFALSVSRESIKLYSPVLQSFSRPNILEISITNFSLGHIIITNPNKTSG